MAMKTIPKTTDVISFCFSSRFFSMVLLRKKMVSVAKTEVSVHEMKKRQDIFPRNAPIRNGRETITNPNAI